MNKKYKLGLTSFSTGKTSNIVRLEDNVFIPFDPANTDYQQYLKWVAEGNTPEPADEPQSE
jgi:hypothetical protein